ncbi:Gfo/Idh/MocA family oxidoreductase [Bacillaceae bacterium SIJ1]|uniref:Gfo/Idh/MocA family protein n=1 Tax=Litoribacterium kuwaitense TaxID=1398745 RepID=UPI0013EC7E4D|nr:Gfo/Idh/MocA family oxidoreductase [Litoribacterium kuwaitense]NGP45715.1 Gfo/Idh/MocA family oxidoreductase [Litoribacterium kuwaitense]
MLEMNSNFFRSNFKSAYLPQEDRHIFKDLAPQYKFVIIGAGMIGMEHIEVTMLEGRATIHGIYDVDKRSMAHTKKQFEDTYEGHTLHCYSSLQEACHDPHVDALIICTPNYTHIDIVREAVQSGKHIMLEKPMATTLADAIEIRELAASYSGVFQIGLQYRHKAIYSEAIHEALERRAIGDVKTISIVEHRLPFLDKVRQWNKFSKYSGGTLVEKACHYFDLLNLFAQARPKTVYATGGQAVNFKEYSYDQQASDVLDHAQVTVVYENDIHTSFNLCMFAPMFYEEITLCGNQGRLKAYENSDFLPAERPETYLEVLSGEHQASRISTPCYPKVIQSSGHHGGTYYEHKYFIDNIEGRKTTTATVDEGFWSIVVGLAAEESIRTNQAISIEAFLADHCVSVSDK